MAMAAREGAVSGPRDVVATALSQGGALGIPFFAAHLCGFLGALAWAEDVRGEAATTTLTTINGRTAVFVARTITSIVVALLCALACCLVVFAVIGASIGWNTALSDPAQLAVQAIRTVGSFAFLTVVYANTTVILRSATLAVFAVLAAQFLAEPLVRGVVLLVPSLQRFIDELPYLPFGAADSLRAPSLHDAGFSLLDRPGTTAAVAESSVVMLALLATAAACFRLRDP
ncbi:MAG: hypothetical protein J7518_11135 [Nocardioidaceae bacterium]|nr:hypothetical protein [Nocardioidaceae bacterium]